MLVGSIALVLLAAPRADEVRLASLGLSTMGLSPEQASFYSEHLALRLGQQPHLRVTTEKDIAALLGVERQKELLGCADAAASCLAELVGALGVDGILTGQLARVGRAFQINIKVLAGTDASTLFTFSKKVADEEELVDELGNAAEEAAVRLWEKLAPAKSKPPAAASPRHPKPPWVLVGAGGASLVGGAIFLIKAGLDWNLLTGPGAGRVALADAQAAQSDGRISAPLGSALAAVGVACLAGGFLWLGLGSTRAQVTVLPSGAGVSWSGALP